MPEIGEIKRANQIGFSGRQKYIWVRCEVCGKERWKFKDKYIPQRTRCRVCFLDGASNPKWNGGICHKPTGYKLVLLPEDDFFYPMTTNNRRKNRYVPEHRLVMAKKLGRCLNSWEHVHHKGIRYADIRNKSDNLEDNLELTTLGSHSREHSRGYRDGYAKGLIDGRDKQIEELKMQNEDLRKEIRLLLFHVKEGAQYVTPADKDLSKY